MKIKKIEVFKVCQKTGVLLTPLVINKKEEAFLKKMEQPEGQALNTVLYGKDLKKYLEKRELKNIWKMYYSAGFRFIAATTGGYIGNRLYLLQPEQSVREEALPQIVAVSTDITHYQTRAFAVLKDPKYTEGKINIIDPVFGLWPSSPVKYAKAFKKSELYKSIPRGIINDKNIRYQMKNNFDIIYVFWGADKLTLHLLLANTEVAEGAFCEIIQLCFKNVPRSKKEEEHWIQLLNQTVSTIVPMTLIDNLGIVANTYFVEKLRNRYEIEKIRCKKEYNKETLTKKLEELEKEYNSNLIEFKKQIEKGLENE